MAKDQTRRLAEARGRSKQQRNEVGSHGSSWGRNQKDDPNVRKQRGRDNDGRIVRSRAEQEANERLLRRLDAELSQQVHVPYRPGVIDGPDISEWIERSTREQGVPLKVEDPETLQKVATLLRVPNTAKPKEHYQMSHDVLELLHQGYHVNRVAERCNVPVERLLHFVGKDGYIKC